MKRLTIIIAAIMAAVSVSSTNYITIADSVRINPNRLGGYSQHIVRMHIDGMCDNWQMAVEYPQGLFPKLVAGVTPCNGLTVNYTDRNGNSTTYTPNLNVSVQYQDISAYIPVQGWWDYNQDGEYESYGTAKWEAGDYDLFEFNLAVDPAFRSGYITFDGTLSSGYDQRGAVLQGVRFFSRVYFWVGYEPGDVAGNGMFNVGDVTMLISYILGKDITLNEFQIAAADVNRDGMVNVADVTELIKKTLNN